ncbi:MAG: GH116 family glycosyl hydrolase [Planctomycetota bacterium]
MDSFRTGRSSGIPLGGLGTGSVELRADGGLYEWRIFNNHPWGHGPATDVMERDGLWFGLVVRRAGTHPRLFLLREPGRYDHFLNDPYHMPWMEYPSAIHFKGRFPVADLEYDLSGDCPVEVRLTAFSPFIPLDSRNSGVPAAVFSFHVVNTGLSPVDVTLVAGLRNAVLYDEPAGKPEIFFNGGGIILSRESDHEDHASYGCLALCTAGGEVSWTHDPVQPRQVWEPLMQGVRLAELEHTRHAKYPYGILAQHLAIGAGESAEMPFILSWFFPNMYEGRGHKGDKPVNIGHRYTAWSKDAEEVSAYVLQNYAYLRAGTMEFLDTFRDSSAEPWLLDAVNAQLSTLVTSSWWDRKGRFGIWEGLGCCGLQTMDITHYGSFPIALFFPDIQKSQMRLSTANVEPGGRLPHMMPGSFACGDKDEKDRIDLMPQFILLVWRDVRWTDDRAYAAEMYPFVKGALAFMRGRDTDGDGLPNNKGPDQTYDQFPMFGTTAFVGLLHVASLAAAADLADWAGDAAQARAWREEYPRLMAELDRQLWNGEYYNLAFDRAREVQDTGCMLDQLNGEWFLRQAGHPGIVPRDRVRCALATIHRLNRTPYGYWQNCVWPAGQPDKRRPAHVTDQAGTPWTGVEFAAAAHMVMEGLPAEGLEIARAVFDRYERAGLRFNHIECGEHYYRALSAWALYLALQGFAYDAPAGALGFRAAGPTTRTYLFNTPTAWGRVSIPGTAGGNLAIEVRRGALNLRRVSLAGMAGDPVHAAVNGQPAACTAARDGDTVTAVFAATVNLRMGSELVIEYARHG